MSVRYRKSISIGPGLRLNLTKTGMGMTVGGHGVHYSVHSGNRRTTSVHLGPGLTWTKRSSGSRASIATGAGPFRSQTAVAPPAPPHPHLWQQGARALLALIRDQRLADRAALEAVAAAHREVALPARLLAGFAAAANGDLTDAATDFQAVITDPLDVAAHPFTVAYFGPCGIHLHIALADRITVDLPPSRDAARLALAEVYAHDDRVTDAIAVLDGMTHTSPVLIAVCDLYLKAERFSDIVTLTANVHNVDDSTALLLVFRGVALRELSQPEAAIAAFGEVIRFRSRAAQVRHHALAERATTYLELGRARCPQGPHPGHHR